MSWTVDQLLDFLDRKKKFPPTRIHLTKIKMMRFVSKKSAMNGWFTIRIAVSGTNWDGPRVKGRH